MNSDSELLDLFAKRVSVHPEKVRGLNLVPVCFPQRNADQRALDFPEQHRMEVATSGGLHLLDEVLEPVFHDLFQGQS